VLLVLGLVSIEAAVNMTITSVTTVSRTNYLSDNEASEALAQSIMPNDHFFRIEKITRKTKNDGAWLNFPTVSLFSSTANADLSKFFKKVGCESSTNAYSITGSTPLIDSLFSVRYGIYSSEPEDTGLISKIDAIDNMYLYENSYTLPLGFVFPYDFEGTWRDDFANPADVQNDMTEVLGARHVLEEMHSEVLGTSFSFTTEIAGDYYVYVSNNRVEKVNASMGERSKTFSNVNRGFLLELGWIEAGEEVTLRNEDNEQDLVAMAYRFVPEGLESVYNVLNQNSMKMETWTDTELKGTIEVDKAGLLFLSIPYDEGWTIRVDGEIEKPYKMFDTFLSVRLSEGSHEVSLEYMPQGLKTGAVITTASVLLLALSGFLSHASDKKKRKMRQY
jgi:uncharacterized membrane protein YfhO